MQNRFIPKYLCFNCNTWQQQYPTNIYKSDNNIITHMYCENCMHWIPVSLTSLFTGEKYIIRVLQYPSIIDNDFTYNKIIFQGNNLDALSNICYKYNTNPCYNFEKACKDYRKYINDISMIFS